MVSAIGRVSPDGLIVVGVSRDKIPAHVHSYVSYGFLCFGGEW